MIFIKVFKIITKQNSLLIILSLLFSDIAAQRKMTTFHPEKNGFQFINTGFKPFVGDAGSIKIDFSGFCGGMTYAAGDYFYNRRITPNQDYSPAPGTKLYGHLHSRQSKSIENFAGQVAEYKFTVFNRDHEFWRWGVDHKLKELIRNLDNNRPTPILLLRINKGIAENHIVMAIGYDLGGYSWKNEKDPNVNNIKIFTYDPNEANKVMALIPRKKSWDYKYGEYNFKTNTFKEKEDWSCRTYHPNKDFYKDFPIPPAIPNLKSDGKGLVYRLVAKCKTGNDDLRGGSDQVSFTIKYQNDTKEHFENVNLSQRWPDKSLSNAELNLKKPVLLKDIKSIELSTNFGGGFNGENWNLDEYCIDAYQNNGSKVEQITGFNSGKPWKRFTGKYKRIEQINNKYIPDSAVAPNKNLRLIAFNILNIKTPIHNNDCKRVQGKIVMRLYNISNGKEYKSINGNILSHWVGNKSKDFAKYGFGSLPTKEIKYYINKDVFEKGKYMVKIEPVSLQRCHKKCDLCGGYHCNIIYKPNNFYGIKRLGFKNNTFFEKVKLKAFNKRNGRYDGHDLDIELSVSYR